MIAAFEDELKVLGYEDARSLVVEKGVGAWLDLEMHSPNPGLVTE